MNRTRQFVAAALFLMTATVLATLSGAAAGPERPRIEEQADRMTDRLVDCPRRIEDRCLQLARRRSADIDLLYTANYTSRPGQAYFLEVNDSTWKLDGRTMTISDRR